MDTQAEDKFKRELFDKYQKTKKTFIPKDEYYQLVDEVKAVSQQTNLKTRHEYYLLAK